MTDFGELGAGQIYFYMYHWEMGTGEFSTLQGTGQLVNLYRQFIHGKDGISKAEMKDITDPNPSGQSALFCP